MVMNLIPDWLSMRAQLTPDRLALTNGQELWTFLQLDQLVRRLTTRLSRLGINDGSRVAILAESSMPIVAVIHALTKLHAILVPLNPRLMLTDLETMLNDAEPAVVIGPSSKVPSFSHTITIEELWDRLDEESLADPSFINLDQIQCLMYTSGTTGQPKGALLSYGNIFYSASFSAIHNGTLASDLWLHMMPLYHIGGLSIIFRSVITGNGIVLLPRFDTDEVFEMMSRYPISLMSLVPTMLYRLLSANKPFPTSLRLILLGGAPPAPTLIDEALTRQLPVVQTYGLTETSSQIATQLVHESRIHKNAGHAIYPTDVAILSHYYVTHKPHQTGEIVVKGPTVFQGYWHDPDQTKAVFWQDWLKTGDVGFLDENGYIHVIDRQKDLIIRGGENISPTEIERAFLAHPKVSDAGVLAMEDAEWGQVPLIMLVTTAPITLAECITWAQTHLSAIKRPVKYYHAKTLPRTASGKLRRVELRQMWQNGAFHEIL
ncbi:MAG: o-succinylbenzoate--CoA ligase [Sulfobacillus thermosulfidooxidans]|uniref:2-succinylbenzoate--CoA ligase n=1 Tax=Sulfobacillus thermosulfidooxidans TaxID=28034 RepID=A0A2T2WRS5_SULTH|nr:MAG: o-succinylbenzoate--CoA ligase [Sulfobacillus thermosulfidooxidans]